MLFCDYFLYPFAVNMSLPGVDMLDFRPAPRPEGASSFFASPNQFAVLPDSESDTEDIAVPPQPNSRKSRIPPIIT
jgi:hypothetical protein